MRKHAFGMAIALAVVAPFGHAASNASASLGDFRFQLQDLDAKDGVTASYNWLSGAQSGVTSLDASAADQDGDGSASKNKNTSFFSYSLNGSSDHANAQASMGAWSQSASGLANGSNSNFDATSVTGQGGSGVLGNLQLSAHSRLTITASASVLASAADPGGLASDWSKALASMGLSYAYGSGSGAVSQSFTDSLTASTSAGGYYDYLLNPDTHRMEMTWVAGASSTDSRSRDLTVVFENTSSVAQYATLTLLTQVSGVGASVVMAPVPEPASAWIALAGIAAMGVAVRKRQRNGA